MKAALSAIAAGTAALALLAPAQAQTNSRERISRVVVYGSDPCPQGPDGEIVVCARRPDGERYRVPRELRDEVTADDPESTSWAAKAESLEYVGRGGIQSCSTTGPGGASGCWAEMMRAWRSDRRQPDSSQPD
ncbi:hypothetical protein E2493_06510 [Sphingomonas parva]|uniref:Uncharacterized protein n=1 Tax=Sphingomonas parva TaxID=2555898 RepID=A0A4Y8ZT25_9SPHN|nr:hypothetical protein [Sphingomonas parva]TFI59171.1 hypothetical protein E2493_06510 [Sphingomonas parva]